MPWWKWHVSLSHHESIVWKHPFGNLKRCLEDFQVHPLKWPWLGHCAGAQYARRLSCSTWRTISCHQCPWSIKIDINMWGKELTTCFWVFQLGWWKMCLDFFLWRVVYRLATLTAFSDDALWKKVTRSYSEPGCFPLSFDQLKQTTWVWRYGFPSFGETPFVGRPLSKICTSIQCFREGFEAFNTSYTHIHPRKLSQPLRNDGWKATFRFKGSLFRGHVNFFGEVTFIVTLVIIP